MIHRTIFKLQLAAEELVQKYYVLSHFISLQNFSVPSANKGQKKIFATGRLVREAESTTS